MQTSGGPLTQPDSANEARQGVQECRSVCVGLQDGRCCFCKGMSRCVCVGVTWWEIEAFICADECVGVCMRVGGSLCRDVKVCVGLNTGGIQWVSVSVFLIMT